MHRLALELVLTAERTPQDFASFQRHIPVELILQALAETGPRRSADVDCPHSRWCG
jgi:hypothetical protein